MYYPAVTFCREPAFKIDVMTVKHLTCGESSHTSSYFAELQLVISSIDHLELEGFPVRHKLRLPALRRSHLHARRVLQHFCTGRRTEQHRGRGEHSLLARPMLHFEAEKVDNFSREKLKIFSDFSETLVGIEINPRKSFLV